MMVLWGRADEQLAIDRLLGGARDGRSGRLVIRGDAGIGKSALLRYAERAAGGMRVLSSHGVETEAEFAYAGLHMLLRPVLDRIDALPRPQAAALRRVLALSASDGADDKYLVGLAVLSLLSDLAEDQPVLCLIDDAHWMDTASADALIFAARRLDSEGVVLLAAGRDPRRSFPGAALPELRLAGLDQASAALLLDERAAGIPQGLRARVLAEAAGNPLALIELAAHAGVAGMDGPGPLPAARDMFAAQLRELGEPARTVLLLAAAEPTGELAVVAEAARQLDADPEAIDSAEQAGLVRVTANRLEFRHPLIRSAAYHDATPADRRAAHRALADALHSANRDEFERRAWHIAAATVGWDEGVAASMESAALRSLNRGGYVAAAAAYERAAALTRDRGSRARRLLAAATAANDGGDLDRAVRLADEADRFSGDELQLARLALLRAQMPASDGAERISALLAAATPIRDRDPDLVMDMFVHAVLLAWTHFHKRLAVKAADLLRDALARENHANHVEQDDRGCSAASFAAAAAQQARLVSGDLTADRDAIDDFLAAIRASPAAATPRERLVAAMMSLSAGDHEATMQISATLVADCRAQSMVAWLAGALHSLALAQIMTGDWDGARTSALEGFQLATDTGQQVSLATGKLLGWLAALAGDEDGFRSWMERAPDVVPGSEIWFLSGRAQLDLARGQLQSALDHLVAFPRQWHAGTIFVYVPDLVEAAVGGGQPARARREADRFVAWAERTPYRWAHAVAQRCLALVTSDELHFAAAVRLHDGAGRPFEQARTQLLYGEWLRRSRRRADARVQLAASHEIFTSLGASLWAERARRELAAVGVRAGPHARKRGPLARLTPQEQQVIRLAAAGLSNRDIAAQLFLSPRTVGHHLYKAYPKLGVTSRGELSEKITSTD